MTGQPLAKQDNVQDIVKADIIQEYGYPAGKAFAGDNGPAGLKGQYPKQNMVILPERLLPGTMVLPVLRDNILSSSIISTLFKSMEILVDSDSVSALALFIPQGINVNAKKKINNKYNRPANSGILSFPGLTGESSGLDSRFRGNDNSEITFADCPIINKLKFFLFITLHLNSWFG